MRMIMMMTMRKIMEAYTSNLEVLASLANIVVGQFARTINCHGLLDEFELNVQMNIKKHTLE